MNLVRFPIMLNKKKRMNILKLTYPLTFPLIAFIISNLSPCWMCCMCTSTQSWKTFRVSLRDRDTLTIDGKTFRLEPSRVPLMSLTDSFNACEIQNCENPKESIADAVVGTSFNLVPPQHTPSDSLVTGIVPPATQLRSSHHPPLFSPGSFVFKHPSWDSSVQPKANKGITNTWSMSADKLVMRAKSRGL